MVSKIVGSLARHEEEEELFSLASCHLKEREGIEIECGKYLCKGQSLRSYDPIEVRVIWTREENPSL